MGKWTPDLVMLHVTILRPTMGHGPSYILSKPSIFMSCPSTSRMIRCLIRIAEIGLFKIVAPQKMVVSLFPNTISKSVQLVQRYPPWLWPSLLNRRLGWDPVNISAQDRSNVTLVDWLSWYGSKDGIGIERGNCWECDGFSHQDPCRLFKA